MLCKECNEKGVVRGVKHITCFKCGKKDVLVNYAYSNICPDCSYDYVICQYCGKNIVPKEITTATLPKDEVVIPKNTTSKFFESIKELMPEETISILSKGEFVIPAKDLKIDN